MNVVQVLKKAKKILEAENTRLHKLQNVIESTIYDADHCNMKIPGWLLQEMKEWIASLGKSAATRAHILRAEKLLRKLKEWQEKKGINQ